MDNPISGLSALRPSRALGLTVLIILSGCSFNRSLGQKQLVFLKHGNVVARYFEGSYMKCVLRNGRYLEGAIKGLTEFSMTTSMDTIPFLSIAKMDVRSQHHINVQNGIGGLFFLGGFIYLAADGFNKALGFAMMASYNDLK